MKKNAIIQVSDLLNKHNESIDALISAVSFYIKIGGRENAIMYLNKLNFFLLTILKQRNFPV